MTAENDDPALAAVLKAGMGGRGNRSSLYAWMSRHFDTLSAEFQANGTRWKWRTQAIGEAGLKDETGKAPTVRRVQQTWYRVVRDKTGGKRKRRQVSVTEPVQPVTRPSFPVNPPLVRVVSPFDQPSDEAEPGEPEIKFASLKGAEKP